MISNDVVERGMCEMYGALLTTNDISVIEELITFIADNGVMIVISAVVIYFLERVLNNMLNQNSQMVSQLSPKISELEELLNNLIVKFNESEARQNLSMNKQFSEIQNTEKDLMNRVKSLNKELLAIDKSLAELTSEIKKQHVYMDFYQEQLKKEKRQ